MMQSFNDCFKLAPPATNGSFHLSRARGFLECSKSAEDGKFIVFDREGRLHSFVIIRDGVRENGCWVSDKIVFASI